MSRLSSTFGFAGSVDRLSIRVQLFQKGIQSLDFDRFNQDNNVIDERPSKSRLDDVTFKWKQKVGRAENSNRRIFTLRDGDEFPDYLSRFKPTEVSEPAENKKESEYPHNDYIVYRKSAASRPTIKKSYLYIFARLGPMDIEDPSAVELISRITVTDTNRLTVEPAINQADDEGIVLETKFGDYTVKIQIDDVENEKSTEDQLVDNKIGRSRKARASVTSIPESETFMAARDGLVETVVHVKLIKGVNFLFDEGLTIDYKLQMPRGIKLKSENATGRSQRYSSAEQDGGDINFGYFLEFVFESRNTDFCPLLMLRFMAVDYWGRQYIAGYGSGYVSLTPGKSLSKIHLWRPISHNSLYEMFVGQAIDIDYFGTPKSSLERVGRDGQPSGIVIMKTDCVAQSRQFMARDILYQLKYGSKMADMGLRSDFYQRIIKVLMEFEEARSKLIIARAINKKKIKM
ncbi:MecKel-Gruber Syndrome (MKS) homolog [Caenorhabditis elegans]|uniref:MecKel-Gruber Syndrome (MKS) homolog n=1 Tax=Caenorhabditis elegans TaxID=6239 RepID=A0A679L8Q5_CAEEL|nr:MecKel-Gruber Syndrome (MKS) homolog [Caenorhabditis elegans]CAA9991435.1 MecKel-Gruber Syndrome (MKS) homolog [Caenorhabditis elegans]